ncbi:MAG: transglycosylase domain-containing protein, partial [Mycobacteriales bacterium]
MVAPGPATARPVARHGAAKRRRRRRRTRLVARGLLVGVLALVVGIGTFIGGLLAAPINLAVAPPPASALLLAADGRQFATIAPPEKREEVKAADIPDVMRQAIISAEDERFLKHNGVDPLATVRAVFRDLTGGSTQGGSTLTQQYVKNAYVGNERTALRKIREAALAYRLEQRLSKQQIITDYLNALYLGNGLYGVQAASKYYFGVPVKDLDLNKASGKRDRLLALARASLLAGIAPAPSVWNPIK